MPSNSYVVVFTNKNAESRRVKALIRRTAPTGIQEIPVSTEEEDVPRLVTEERVFLGYKQIEEYFRVWLSSQGPPK